MVEVARPADGEAQVRDMLHFCPGRYDVGVVVPTGVAGPTIGQVAARMERRAVEHTWRQRLVDLWEPGTTERSKATYIGLVDGGRDCSRCMSRVSADGQLSYADQNEVELQQRLAAEAAAEEASGDDGDSD